MCLTQKGLPKIFLAGFMPLDVMGTHVTYRHKYRPIDFDKSDVSLEVARAGNESVRSSV